METENKRYEDKKEVKSRYMTNEKKRYYLASTDENIQMLINQQKDELTRVLIDLKSELDGLTRQSSTKERETREMDKKIKILEEIQNKKKKKFEEITTTNENVKSAIELKKQKKTEEEYQKKTLIKQIENLKTDILLIQKEIYDEENEAKKLDKIFQKERFRENDIRERKNQVYSKIKTQNKKNEIEQNDQDLQIEYYEAIIDQKNDFIQSADERKERQRIIAQKAKNDSHDKQEIQQRFKLELITLYNQYLREKMKNLLEKNENLEKIFNEIRDICGTADLQEIVDFILYKDKRYNYTAAIVAQKENQREVIKQDIGQLEKLFINLKNDSK